MSILHADQGDRRVAVALTLTCGCSFTLYADTEKEARAQHAIGHWHACVQRHSPPIAYDPDDGSVRKWARDQQVVSIEVQP